MIPFSHDDFSGYQFLALYGALLILAIWLGFVIPGWLRAHGGSPRALDEDHTALLAGGPQRFFDLIVTRLLAARALRVTEERAIEIVAQPFRRTPAEAAVLALPSPLAWNDIASALRPHMLAARGHLVSAGLLMGGGRVFFIRLCQTLPYALLIAFGLSRWRYGTALGHPVGFLTALLIFTLLFALIRFFTREPRTQGGIVAVEEAQARAERLQRAPTSEETVLAVALFGTVVLAGSGLGDFHALRSNSGNSADGGGGCGGGGCGGCGGCGG